MTFDQFVGFFDNHLFPVAMVIVLCVALYRVVKMFLEYIRERDAKDNESETKTQDQISLLCSKIDLLLDRTERQ